MEKHIITLSREMTTRGHRTLLLVPRRNFLPKYENIDSSVEVIRLGAGIPTTLSSTRIIGTFVDIVSNNLDFLFSAWKWAQKSENARKIDLIHVHSDSVGLFGYSLRNGHELSKWMKKPLVLSLHQKIGTKNGDLPAQPRLFERYFRNAERIIVHRKHNLQYLCEWGYKDKTVFIPILIDVKRFQKPSSLDKSSRDIVRILYVGRLDHRRDPITLIKAFSLVHNVHKDTQLHIVGYGGLESQVKELVGEDSELSKVVFFHGKQLDVRKYLWNSDIYISLNVSDNYSSVALREAMAAGLASVVTDVGETRDLIRGGVNGLLVPPCDPSSVSSTILALVKNEKLRRQLSLNAQISSESFDVSKISQIFMKVYCEAMSR